MRAVLLVMWLLFGLRGDSANVMSAAKKVMASVAQDLVDEALQDELAQVGNTRACPSLWFDLAAPPRLHIQLFTAA